MSYADRYDPDTDFDHWYTDATGTAIVDWVRPDDDVLELGCATGRMTERFARAGARVVAVDHATSYLERARARHLAGVTYLQADIQAFASDDRFDHVVLANVVHEVADPAKLFRVAADHLRPGGYLHVTLQNPRSIHRLVGLEMGLIAQLAELSERGRDLDTIEVFDVADLERFGRESGLRVVHRAGIMLKPLPNDLMSRLPDDILEGLVRAARHLPDHCSMNFLVFRRESADLLADG